MENTNRSNENDFIKFFRGLDEMKKPPDKLKDSTKVDSAGLAGDPKSR